MCVHKIDGVDILRKKLGPKVPIDLGELRMQAFHGVSHPAAKRDHKKNKQIQRLRPQVRPAVTGPLQTSQKA